MGRDIIPTETGDTITDDACTDGRQIRLWSADWEYIGRWCFNCNRFHKP